MTKRRWLYIDVDPVKPEDQTDNPATDNEHDGTVFVCDAVNQYLSEFDWPTPIMVDSGNGYGLFWRCDLKNDKESQKAFRQLLIVLDAKFSGEKGTVDKSVHNANRLAKLPGTWARKGQQSDDRPHRPCRFVFVPETIGMVGIEQLIAAGGNEENPAKVDHTRNGYMPPATGTAYAKKALDDECLRVVMAKPGAAEGRNNALNRAAFSLGQLVAGGALIESEVESRLFDAGCKSGLDADPNCGERGIRGTIRRGLEAGKKTPRGVPESNDPKATIGKGTTTEQEHRSGLEWVVSIDGEVVADGEPKEFLPEIDYTKRHARHFEFYTLGGLMEAVFPEPRWAIAGILSEGLNILAGKPKMGKSMMALNLAMTVASGGMALGNMQTTAGNVLYLSLEDRSRRIQSRARKMLRGIDCKASGKLTLATTWPRQGEGGLEMIEWWMKRVSRPGLCIIDVWGKFRPPGNPKANSYTQDYEHMSPLKDLMDKYGCCGLALMHLRKGASDDAVEDISGTLGIAGAADGMMILKRARNDNEAKVFITGRDVADSELALKFDPENLIWTNLGSADEHVTGKLQIGILEYLKERKSAFVPDIAEHLTSEEGSVRKVLHRLYDKKLVRRVGNAWAFPGGDDEHWTNK